MGKTVYYQSVTPQAKLMPKPQGNQPSPPAATKPWNIEPIIDNVAEQRPPAPEGCVCNREVVGVVCPNCGYFKKDLKSVKPCKIHPKVKYLYDLSRCPHCKGLALEEAKPEDMGLD